MADLPGTPKPTSITHVSDLKDARVQVAGNDKLRVEFKIDDLVKKLLPGGEAASSCGGCRGCMGCSMIDFAPEHKE